MGIMFVRYVFKVKFGLISCHSNAYLTYIYMFFDLIDILYKLLFFHDLIGNQYGVKCEVLL